MRIVVFGATGAVGSRIVAEAARRNHDVVGVARDPDRTPEVGAGVRLVRGDATDVPSVVRDIRGADAVVCAISPRPGANGEPAPSLVDAARAIIAGARETGVRRILTVGGAGSLEIAPGKQLMDQPDFPAAYKPEAIAGREALEVWRREGDGLDWTYISPAAEIKPGERTGQYRTTDDRLLVDDRGKSEITYEDYAVAVLDEIENPQHVGKRFGVAY
jgi:putative NADH-flavin reductase